MTADSLDQTESIIEDIIVNVFNKTQEQRNDSSSFLNTTSNPLEPLNSSTPQWTVSLWIDLPNIFPWRQCVQQYNNLLTVLGCDQVSRPELNRFHTEIKI